MTALNLIEGFETLANCNGATSIVTYPTKNLPLVIIDSQDVMLAGDAPSPLQLI